MNNFLKRKWLFIPYILLGLLVVGWTGFWFFGKNKADDMLNLTLNAQKDKGVEIECGDRSIGGYPLKYSVSCNKLKVTSKGVSVTVPKLQAVAQLWNKNHVIAELEMPIVWQNSPLFTISGEPMMLSVVRPQPDEYRFSLTQNNGKMGDKGQFSYGNSEIHASKTLEGLAENGKFHIAYNDIKASSDDAAANKLLPQLKTVMMSGDSLFTPRLGENKSVEDVKKWFQAGGKVTLRDYVFTINAIKMQASGQFELDKDKLLNGTLNVTFSNIEPIVDYAKNDPQLNMNLQGAILFAKKEVIEGKNTYSFAFVADKGQIKMQGMPIYRLPPVD